MKKIICLILFLVMMFSLVGCLEIEQPKKETGNQTPTVVDQQPKDETFALNETAVFKNLKFTATELLESQGESFFTPESGNVFVGIKFIVENISNEDQNISSLLMFSSYADDIKCDYSFSATCAFDEGILDGELAPGKKMVGWYALEVPEDWSEIEIAVKADFLSSDSAKFVFNK